MLIKYKMAKWQLIASLGMGRYGAIIDDKTLKIYQIRLLPTKVNIDDIDEIFLGINASPVYILNVREGKQICIPISFFEGIVHQTLIKDLIKINPEIRLHEVVEEFINSEIKPFGKLKFDFKNRSGEFFQRDLQLGLEHPSIDTAIGFSIVAGWIIIILLFGYGGNELLSKVVGEPVQTYRIISLVISALALCVSLTNIFIALISMYLGHKVTVISLLISLCLIIVSFV